MKDCEEVKSLLTGRLTGQLDPAEEAAAASHLANCETCRGEARELERLWHGLAEIDPATVPSDRMRARFYRALADFDVRPAHRRLGEGLLAWWPRRPAAQLGYVVAALVIGLLLGPRLLPSQPGSPPVDTQIADLRAELRSMGRTVTVSLLQHQSAAERLRGIGWAREAAGDPEVAAALLEVLNYDSNVNVRLAALEALGDMRDRPAVTAGLVKALDRQSSPLLQVGLVDTLLELDPAAADAAIRSLVERSDVVPAVVDAVRRPRGAGKI